MRRISTWTTCVWLIVGSIVGTAVATASDWPRLLGPSADGSAPATGIFDSIDVLGVEERWRRPLGSGYASMIAVGDRVYTTHSEGDSDFAAALELASGRTVWKTRLGPRHRSGNAADDGILASPAVSGDAFYTLTAKGEVFALSASSGEIRWRVDLVETLGAKPPFYGFSSSPLIDGPRLIVQAGGETANNLVAFDRDSGDLLWSSHHAEGHTYASPVAMEIEGVRQVVALAGNRLIGVDGPSGRLLWSLESPETEPDRLLPVPGGRIFLPLYQNGGWMVAVERESDAWRARELWLQPSVKSSHGTPVYHDGLVYAFQGSILLCLDAGSGEVLWRERVYDGSLILVDGWLLLLSRRSGLLHVIEPSRDGYREVMRERVFEPGQRSITPPAFASRTLLLRNLEQAVALRFGERARVAAQSTGDEAGDSSAVLWRLELEEGIAPSGTSPVTPHGDSLYTLMADTEAEYLLAVAAADGSVRWRRRLDSLFEGAKGGARGGVVVRGDRLYAVTTACRLHALTLAGGEPLWQADLLGALGGGARRSGCETTPVAAGDRLVVNAAGDDRRRVIALSATTGELIWSNDQVERPLYTSGLLATIDGVPQVVIHSWRIETPNRSRLQGLALADGALLWQHDIDEDWSWNSPVELSAGTFLVPTWNRATAVRVSREEGAWNAERLWQEGRLETPVVVGDEVCGERGGGVSCVSAATGAETRRLETGTVRLTGDGSRLVAVSYDAGWVQVLDLAEAGLESSGREVVLSVGAVNETPAALATDRVYLRNNEELVALRVR